MQKPGWYLNRLSRMSVPEVVHRLRTGAMARIERLGLAGAGRAPPLAPGSTVPWIYFDEHVDRAMLRENADRILENRYPVFALDEGPAGGPVEWNRDPLTGTLAPLSFGKTLDYRSESVVGNIKYLWEPNRHLELVTLAQACRAFETEPYLDGIRNRVASWLEQCPYRMGPNWSSSLELGIRLINWSIAWSLLDASDLPVFDRDGGDGLRDRWLESIYQHIHFIDGHYSKFSSANNHVIGEAAGVYIAASFWPFRGHADECRDRARQILVSASQEQTYPDGVNKEQAISYQQFVADFLLFAGLAGERCRQDHFPNDYWARIEHMVEFIAAAMDTGGNVPMIGDADDGFVARLAVGHHCPYRSLMATAALRFDRPDLAAQAGRMDGKTRSLLGPGAGEKFEALVAKGNVRSRSERSFPDGGYYIFGRDLGGAEEIRLTADCGPLGYLSIAAHGHADALSFVLSVAGREVLVDPGTYSYHTDRKWREYFRGTGAHNTVRVDGQDQSVQGGNFMWLHHAASRCIEFGGEADAFRFSGEHTGYARLDDPVVHRRDIELRGTMIQVSDRLGCDGYHSIERCWHFSEDCRVSISDDAAVLVENGRVRVRLWAREPASKVRHLRGSESPPGGWVSRRFDVKEPSDTVYFVNEIEGTTTLETFIECEIRNEQGK